jgi:ABC-type multidrug transport system fused ATPase/permease subunit/aminoglycoside phosphotransferase (APT) family kinase protein
VTGTRQVLLPYLRPQWRALVVAGASTVVVAAAEVLRPFPLKFVIDHLFAGGGAPFALDLGWDDALLLAGVAALVLAIALLEAAGSYLMDVRLMRAGERIVHDLRVAIYAHLQRLSLGFHQRRHTGDLVTRVTGDVNAVGMLFSSSAGTLVSSGLMLIGMVVVAVLLDPLLALVAFSSAPLLGVIAFRFRRRMKTLAQRQRAMEGEIASLAAEALSSMQQVKALGSERYENERLERKSEERLEAGYEATIVEGRFARVIDLVGAIATAAVLVVGVFRVAAGALSPGDLIVMVAYARRVYRPLRAMAREWVRLSRAMARAERVAEVLAADEMLEDRGRPYGGGSLRGELEFDAVSFAYEPARPALIDVSLSIPAGQRLAVVGRSGAGKTTLAALAARFYDPQTGRLLIDGADARDYPLAWLREQIGLVLQDAVLFTGTVAENIAWGIDAGREEVVRAAQAVGADDFIRRLPEGYDTELDPGGTGLSGGQRQRIAIARTLLRDPAILLLDEPTAGLDAKSEAEVLAGLDTLMRGRTTVMIAHALALARRAERVVVLDAGHVVQTGTPDDLLEEDGPFRRLAAEQGLVDEAPPKRPSRPPVIADPRLPQAPVLLDPDAIAPVLAKSFAGGAPLDVRVRYLRYKPGTNLVVQYDVGVNGDRHDAVGMITAGPNLVRRAATPENAALVRLAAGRVAAASPLTFDDRLGLLVQWYPLDLALPALATPPRELRLLLARTGLEVEVSSEEPERLAYKPRRRAVLRVNGHVVKIYRRQGEFERAVAGQRAASTLDSVVAPRLEASSIEWLITVQTLLRGSAVPDATRIAAHAGAVLAELHASRAMGLPEFGPIAQLEAAAASARLVGTIAPDLEPRLKRLLSSLATSAPDGTPLVPSHGDFNARQLLVVASDLGVADFDEFCLAAPALDPATYCAYLVYGRSGDLDAAFAALDELVRGYGERPAHLRWYLATMILRRAPRPFRYFEADWRPRVEQMVAAAERVVGR